jgi:transcriptional regulator with XRE-family HTH domain
VAIGERIKFLLTSLRMSARAFSQALELSDSTVNNYIAKGTMPGADVIEKIALTYSNVNIVWLVTGQGEPFLPGGPQHRSATYIAEYERERDAFKAECDYLRKDIEFLSEKLDLKDHIIYAKDETIAALRGSTKRPY